MTISMFCFPTTRRLVSAAILVPLVLSNVFAGTILRADHVNVSSKMPAMVKYTTDMTQLGREGRLREDVKLESDTNRFITVLTEEVVRQPVIIDEDKAVMESIVEQLALRTAKGN